LLEIVDGVIEVKSVYIEGRPLRHSVPPKKKNPQAETRGGPTVNRRR
jgi:hypothetical protein